MARKEKAPKPLIKAATIATALDKVTGKVLGWTVKSNHTEQYYHVQTEIIGGEREFFCDCEAKDWGCSECCHIKAVKEVLIAKAELAKEQDEVRANLAKFFEFLSEYGDEQRRIYWRNEGEKAANSAAFHAFAARGPIFEAPAFTTKEVSCKRAPHLLKSAS